MRYWVLEDRKPKGPLAAEELVLLAGYDPGWLVCPEDQPSGERSNWRPARKHPEILEAMRRGTGAPATPAPSPDSSVGRSREAASGRLAAPAADRSALRERIARALPIVLVATSLIALAAGLYAVASRRANRLDETPLPSSGARFPKDISPTPSPQAAPADTSMPPIREPTAISGKGGPLEPGR